ncbi:hypothetical protein SK425_23185, partial [Escherichia coli]|uniref:hypothetical protein n=1 Tax=Escherichia coli TaxID=562 RepID=UPI0029F4650B
QMLHLHSAISPYLSGGNCNISVNLHTQSSWWQCAAAEIFNSSEGQMTIQQFYPIGTPGKP